MIRQKYGECRECGNGKHVKLMGRLCMYHYKLRQKAFIASQDKQWSKLSMRIRRERPNCEARLPGCTGRATEVHHKAGRRGKLLLYEPLLMSVCSACHSYIHDRMSIDEAVERGLRVRYSSIDTKSL